MADWRIIGLKLLVLALILLLSINSNSGEKFNDNVRKLHLTKDQADSAPRYSSLIDSNGSLRLANGWQFERNRRDVPADMESDPINPATAVKSYKGEVKKRDKRFLMFLPALAPLFQALFVGTGITAAAVVASQVPLEIPRVTWSQNLGSGSTYMQSGIERKGQLPPGQTKHPAPKTDEITGFPELVPQKSKTPVQGGGGLRKRWKDPKTKKTYEWDSQHGELEGYGKSGDHIGSFDPYTGKQTKDPVPGRKLKD